MIDSESIDTSYEPFSREPEYIEANRSFIRDLDLEQGRTLAEAYMFQLAPGMGREAAHDLVYEAALASKARRVELEEALRAVSADPGRVATIKPEDYTGQAREEALRAVAGWRRGTRA